MMRDEFWKKNGQAKKITSNAIEGGCLQDDPHSWVGGGAWSQLVSIVRVYQFRKELSWTKKVDEEKHCTKFCSLSWIHRLIHTRVKRATAELLPKHNSKELS